MAKSIKETSGTAAKVEELIRPTIQGLGLTLWDVRFESEGGEWYLRVLIDKDGPMDTDTCEAASRAIDPILDEADPIEQSYMLEVGSPGLGRRLCRPHHFAQMQGEEILAKLYAPNENGEKELRGVLQGYDGQSVLLQTQAGELSLPADKASLFKTCDDEGLFGKQGKK